MQLTRPPLYRSALRALRTHQWIKNLLVLVPLITAHRLAVESAALSAVQAVAAFCLASSAVYVFNDLFDLNADRKHPSKRFRAIASGDLPVSRAVWLIPILLTASAAVSRTLGVAFWLSLFGYVAIAVLYTLCFKRFAIIDVLVLGFLYAVRIIAGAAAIDVPVSAWLLAFSMFLFLSLALLKRFSELHARAPAEPAGSGARGYEPADMHPVGMLGIVSGYLSVLVMALYISAPEVTVLYRHPEWLWGFCPLLLYWIGRVWLIGYRGRMHHDPVVFVATDWASYCVGAALAACMWLAI